jgi:FkbM family methyltransferase
MKLLARKNLIIFYGILFRLLLQSEKILGDRTTLKVFNVWCVLTCSPVRFGFCTDDMLYYAKDAEKTHYFSDLRRGISLYTRGLNRRGLMLAKSYFIEDIELFSDDIVVDCGANYGDLWLYLSDKIASNNYIAVEPAPLEYRCLSKNAKASRCLNFALSNKSSEVSFFLNSAAADSSLIEPDNYSEIINVDAKRLDDVNYIKDLTSIKLLKLEAEGWEPEIIEGGIRTLSKVEFITVDGGFERGIHQTETLSQICNILISLGFEMQSINPQYMRSIFKRKIDNELS